MGACVSRERGLGTTAAKGGSDEGPAGVGLDENLVRVVPARNCGELDEGGCVRQSRRDTFMSRSKGLLLRYEEKETEV